MRPTEPIKNLKTYPKKHVTPIELATYVGVPRRTIYHHIEKGALPFKKRGGAIIIRKSDALAYADEDE
jgi:excisionase family DNA binding protein